jgi:hypothetical protein
MFKTLFAGTVCSRTFRQIEEEFSPSAATSPRRRSQVEHKQDGRTTGAATKRRI